MRWWPFKHKHHWHYYLSFYMPDTRWCFGCAGLEHRDWQNGRDWERRLSEPRSPQKDGE